MKSTQMNYDINVAVFWARKLVIEVTDALFEMIERAINWLKGSELDNIQVTWTNQRPEIEDVLKKYLSFCNQRSGSHNQRQLKPFAERMLKLAKLVIPIIKLYRLFVNKLSEREMNRKQLPKFTTMRTHQLSTIEQLPEDVNNILLELLGVLRDSNPTEEQSTYQILSRTIQSLDNKFKDPLLLILLYFLPILPDTDGFPTQQYFNEWFAMWKTLFTIAINFNTVAGVVLDLGDGLKQMTDRLAEAHPVSTLTCRQLTETIQDIDTYTTKSFHLIITHFLPIIPDTNGFPTQNYHRAWFDTWKTLFSIANNDFLHAVKVFQSNGL
ncbi:hypothetical protein PSTG_02508 [Puccinia striiformis f. sp. tritici PST-78]|uniref:Uncharacterized protein n=1 Tax=Puccinia striiformis f. sp. tritici PST-78 TaxID=1165861 RepID=A0A0L0VY87_9BASI|nr:hypothetical protein PSTG_02508 [Puccinia striiformis f. sp. tritici PST-78]